MIDCIQSEVVLREKPRGFHLITRDVEGWDALRRCRSGLLHIFLRHTSASLTINENADADVPLDLETGFNRIAPETAAYRHTCEGPDDMPAHIKSSVLGVAVTVPVAGGKLLLGTWQGIYLCEHRNHGGARKIILTLQGHFDD